MIQTHILQKLLLALLFALSTYQFVEGQSLRWAAAFETSAGGSITTDAVGNTYMTGMFFIQTDFDPGPGSAIATPSSGSDIYVLKLDPNGNFIWLRTVGGVDSDYPNTIKIDQSGNVFVSGYMENGLDFSNVGITAPLGDYFIWKLNPAGNTVWVKGFSATNTLVVMDCEVGENGNVYLVGAYKGTMDMNPGTGSYLTQSPTLSSFLVKLDNAGNFVYGKTFGADFRSNARQLNVDSFGVYIAGDFKGNLYAGTSQILPGEQWGPEDYYVLKLSHAGNMLWVNTFSSNYQGSVIALAGLETDGSGNVHISGSFYGTLDCDPSPSSNAFIYSSIMPPYGYRSAFLMKWDSNGYYLNSGTLSKDTENTFASMEVDAQGNIYLNTVTGKPGEYIDIDLGTNVQLEGSSSESGGIVIKYAPDFSILWVGKHFNPVSYPNNYYGNQSGVVHLASDGSLMLSGRVSLGTDLHPEDSLLNYAGGSTYAAFVYRMNCSSFQSYSSYSACDSISIFGQTFTESGLHHFHFPDGQGCDSVVTAHVDIVAPTILETFGDAARLVTEPIYQAQYQWLYCDSNYAPIPNQNRHYMMVGAIGSYAVAVTIQGCADTSACYTNLNYTPILEELDDLKIAQLREGFRLLLPGTFNASLIDLQGRVLASSEAEDAATFDMQSHPAGVYLVRVRTVAGVASRKIVWMRQ